MSQAPGVVLLSQDAYKRLVQGSTAPRLKPPVQDAESQTESTPTQALPTSSPSPPSILTVKEVLLSIPKYFRPACQSILHLFPGLKICSDGFIDNPEYAPIDGLPLKTLLSGACIPFHKPPAAEVVSYLKSKGICKFRNHRLNIDSDEIHKWVSPYSF